MNDDTLTTALDRMATALEPPAGAEELITARRSRLRRRRRITTGLAAASVVAIVATGGAVASGLGNAEPAPDHDPVASDGPAPSDSAADAADDTADNSAPKTADDDLEVRENDSPWHCGQEAMTLTELQEFRNDVIDEAQLSVDLVDDKVHAYVVLNDESNSAYELEARRLANGEVEIVSARKCKG
jgi:hypothetical protein